MTEQDGDWLGPAIMDGPEGVDRSLLAHCLTLVNSGEWAVEFGVGTGETTRMIARVMPTIGFDSFRGLPEDWRPAFPKGKFGDLVMPVDIEGVTYVIGMFEQTARGYDWPDNLGLVHFDADLYSSTITALDAIASALRPGVILVFDEFHGYDDDFKGTLPGEQQAWWEFVAASLLTWDVIGHGREQWAVRLT